MFSSSNYIRWSKKFWAFSAVFSEPYLTM